MINSGFLQEIHDYVASQNDEQNLSDPPTKKPIDKASLVKKYGSYVKGRESDADLADTIPAFKDLPNVQGGKKIKDIVKEASTKYGIRPEILYSSLMEEGLRDLIKTGDNTGDEQYPVSGFAHFGLDHFSDKFPELVKKGLLPPEFKDKFALSENINEKKQKVNSADFASVEDAVMAKAAMLKDVSNNLNEYATQKGIKLSDKSKEFFMLAGYNGGEGNGRKMIDIYNTKGYLKDDNYLKKAPPTAAAIYINAMRRIAPAEAWKGEGLLDDEPIVSTQPLISPISTPTIKPQLP